MKLLAATTSFPRPDPRPTSRSFALPRASMRLAPSCEPLGKRIHAFPSQGEIHIAPVRTPAHTLVGRGRAPL